MRFVRYIYIKDVYPLFSVYIIHKSHNLNDFLCKKGLTFMHGECIVCIVKGEHPTKPHLYTARRII